MMHKKMSAALRFQSLLWPLACLYDLVMSLRNAAFNRGWLPSRRFPCATIAIGNLAVGGTGKTPHAEYLLRLLSPQHRVALLSRGYGRRTHGFVMANAESTAADIGDEPLQMQRKFPQVQVAVDEKRCEGMERLLAQAKRPEVVVLDDAYQHRYVCAGLYILLTDFSRLYVNDFVLPAGRLRESKRGARRAQIVIVTKCPEGLNEAQRSDIRQRLRLSTSQKLFFTTFRYGERRPLFAEGKQCATSGSVLALTGIARPEPLYEHLRRERFQVTPLRFPDHHAFTPSSIALMNRTFSDMPEDTMVVTTEKDAARLRSIANQLCPSLRRQLLVQPIEVAFLKENGKPTEELFTQIINNYVTSNQTNC